MGAKKDIHRVRELIVGKDIKRFEKKFSLIDETLIKFEEEYHAFNKKISKKFNAITINLEQLREKQSMLHHDLYQQDLKTTMALDEMNNTINTQIERSSEEIKRVKAELKMYIKAKLNALEHTKISNRQLSEIFASLSHELNNVDDNARHTQ